MVSEMCEIDKKYGIHKYRGSHNRHKHGNDFPSYWAMGYKDLAEMKASVTAIEFQQYIQQHCKNNGCCMPNVNERGGFGI